MRSNASKLSLTLRASPTADLGFAGGDGDGLMYVDLNPNLTPPSPPSSSSASPPSSVPSSRFAGTGVHPTMPDVLYAVGKGDGDLATGETPVAVGDV